MGFSRKIKKSFLVVLKAKRWNISKACEEFGISRQVYYKWIKDEWFAEQLDNIEQSTLDEAEEIHRLSRNGIPEVVGGKLVGWAEKPDNRAIEYYLTKKGSERGYVDKKEIDLNHNDISKTETIPFMPYIAPDDSDIA